MKKIIILGSTGSIGKQTLNVVDHLGDVEVVGLVAGKDELLLAEQILRYQPKRVALYDPDAAARLRMRFPSLEILEGIEGICSVATTSGADGVVAAMTGSIGLLPVLAAIEEGKTIALANKEVLVCAGELVMSRARAKKVDILPIDSEHFAISQCLKGNSIKNVSRLILTCSGGPFRNYTEQQLDTINIEEALAHPTWKMGAKITIDSSTLMNKGLEVIEAHYLFNVPLDQIEVIIHPQSIIHSMVEFIDHSLMAQLSAPSMELPIQAALTFPEVKKSTLRPFDFITHGQLQFSLPDKQRFACLGLAYEAARAGGTSPCYLNAANEVMVGRFLRGELAWKQIAQFLEKLLERYKKEPLESVEQLLEVEALSKREAAAIN